MYIGLYYPVRVNCSLWCTIGALVAWHDYATTVDSRSVFLYLYWANVLRRQVSTERQRCFVRQAASMFRRESYFSPFFPRSNDHVLSPCYGCEHASRSGVSGPKYVPGVV